MSFHLYAANSSEYANAARVRVGVVASGLVGALMPGSEAMAYQPEVRAAAARQQSVLSHHHSDDEQDTYGDDHKRTDQQTLPLSVAVTVPR